MSILKPISPFYEIKPATFFHFFLIIYFVSGIIHLGYFPLNGDEPRRAIVSIEMLESGNYIKPTTLGWDYYNKPPVYNWVIVFFIKLTGTCSELAIRLPSLVFMIIWGVVNFYITKRLIPDFLAALSSIFLLTSFDIYFWGLNNGGEIDIFYSFIVYLQVISIFYFNLQRKWLLLFIFSYALCAVGLLTKGFPSVLFQVFTLIALAVYNRSVRFIFTWQHLVGCITFLLLAGAYFYAYSYFNNPWIYLGDLLKESFNKSAFGEYSERLVYKILTYPFSFLKILLPWSVLLVFAWRKNVRDIWQQPLVFFSLLFILFNIAPYWFTGHPRMRYVYMFLPFAMFIIVFLFHRLVQQYEKPVRLFLLKAGYIFVLFLLGLVVLPFFYDLSFLYLAISYLLLSVFIIGYFKLHFPGILKFCLGIVLLRLVFALLIIPLKYRDTSNKYPQHMAAMAAINSYESVSIYKRPEQLDLTIDLKMTDLKLGSIPAIPYMAYQIPYYYYLSTGRVVTYDTLLQVNKNYIGFESDLKDYRIKVFYSFRDANQNNDNVLLFRLKEAE